MEGDIKPRLPDFVEQLLLGRVDRRRSVKPHDASYLEQTAQRAAKQADRVIVPGVDAVEPGEREPKRTQPRRGDEARIRFNFVLKRSAKRS